MAPHFDSLPNAAFLAKDELSRLVRANGPLLRILSCRNESQILEETTSTSGRRRWRLRTLERTNM
jgi:hypothetical protein